jgi:hypothetical protein
MQRFVSFLSQFQILLKFVKNDYKNKLHMFDTLQTWLCFNPGKAEERCYLVVKHFLDLPQFCDLEMLTSV